MSTSRYLIALALLASCGDDAGSPSITSLTRDELYGLWLTADEDGTERVWVFAPRDDHEAVFAGRRELSTLCIGGAPTLLSSFDVLEGHIVETVLEDRGGAGASFGDRFGTEILGYTGDTLTMESATHSSGRRVWKRVSRYEPHEPSGWVRAEADRVQLPQGESGESPFPLGTTSLAFDADGDWHIVASQQPRPSMPGGGSSSFAGAIYGSRKNSCISRTQPIPRFGGYTELMIGPDPRHDPLEPASEVLVLPDNNWDTGQVGIRTRPVGDNRTFDAWQYEALDGLSWIYNDGSSLGPDGTLRFMRHDRTNGGEDLWTIGPDNATFVPLPVTPQSKVVFTSERRACFLTFGPWDADIFLWCEQTDGTFTSKEVTGTAWTGGPPPGSYTLAPTPDGGVAVASCFRGLELYLEHDGAWHLDKLTETPCTGLALAVDDDVYHLRTEVEGRLEYVRWDGDELLRELPSVPAAGSGPWDEFGGDEPRIRLGPEGQVALVVGKGRAVIRPADAERHRQMTRVTVTFEGEGAVELRPVGGAPVTCTATCSIDAPIGLYLPYTTTTGEGWVHVDRDTHRGQLPIDQREPSFRVVFERSHVIGLAKLEPGLRFLHVAPLPSSGVAVIATTGNDSQLGVIDFDSRDAQVSWRWSRSLPPELQLERLVGLPGGELIAFGSIGGPFDLGLGPMTVSTNLGADAVLIRFGPTGTPLWAKQIPGPSSPGPLVALDDEVVFAFWAGTTGTFEGFPLTGPGHLARLVGDTVTELKANQGNIADLALTPDRIYAAGRGLPFDVIGQTASLAAFDRDLDLLWTRVSVWLDTYGIDYVSADAEGRVHGYGASRGGDYGGGELPNPAGPGQPEGAVHVILDADGGFVSATGYPFFETPIAPSADGEHLRFVSPNAQLVELGPNRRGVSLARPQTAVPSGAIKVIGAAWTGTGAHVFLNQTGTMDWVLEAVTHDGGLVLDARF